MRHEEQREQEQERLRFLITQMQNKLNQTERAYEDYRRKIETKKDDAALQVRNLEVLLSKREH